MAGLADDDDLRRDELLRKRKAEAKVAAKKLIKAHELPMKVVAVDHVLEQGGSGGARTTIYFTAPHRVDFRSLVRDLGATLHCRVELRQLSARDSARVQGGIGSCGRDLCCATFLTDFEPVTIRMAKDQDLPLNPLRISGACGRLMCCLKYEHPLYQKFQASAPAVGTRVTTPEGDGRVVGAQRAARTRWWSGWTPTVPAARAAAPRSAAPARPTTSATPARPCLKVPGRPAAGPGDDRRRWRVVRIQHRYPDETPPCRIAAWSLPRLDRAP